MGQQTAAPMVMSDPEKPASKPEWKKWLVFVLNQWLLIGIGVGCTLAYFFPNVAKSGGIIRSQYSIMYGAVAIIFLISGLSISREKLVIHFLNWRLHLVVQGTSFLVVPAIMTALVRAIVAGDHKQLIDRSVLAGYILTGCLPTTIASNVMMTRAAGGDEAAALVEVLIANFMGPFVTPGWTVKLLPPHEEFDVFRGEGDLKKMYSTVFEHLGLSVLLPLVVGLVVRFMWSEKTAHILQKYYVNKISTLCLILIIWTTFSTCFATSALESLTGACVALVLLMNVALYLFLTVVSIILSRWPGLSSRFFYKFGPKQTIAICFCTPAKTTGLGMPLLFAMWATVPLVQQAKASVPVLLYTTEQVFVAHFLVHLFRRWERKTSEKDSEEDTRISQTPQEV